jgi:hypothetical protein
MPPLQDLRHFRNEQIRCHPNSLARSGVSPLPMPGQTGGKHAVSWQRNGVMPTNFSDRVGGRRRHARSDGKFGGSAGFEVRSADLDHRRRGSHAAPENPQWELSEVCCHLVDSSQAGTPLRSGCRGTAAGTLHHSHCDRNFPESVAVKGTAGPRLSIAEERQHLCDHSDIRLIHRWLPTFPQHSTLHSGGSVTA